jgi:hypothetical protein
MAYSAAAGRSVHSSYRGSESTEQDKQARTLSGRLDTPTRAVKQANMQAVLMALAAAVRHRHRPPVYSYLGPAQAAAAGPQPAP